jgi:uncharacterized membrane protein
MTDMALPAPASDGAWWKAGWWLLFVLALAAGIHAIGFGLLGFGGEAFGGNRERMFAIPLVGYAHTLGGALASIIGPFQFLADMRRQHRRLHVWLGRIYLACVAASAVAGLCLSPGSLAHNTLGIAFVALALAWLHTGWQAYAAIRRRDVPAHRRWMIRNYALTYAAVTLRIQLPLLILAGVDPVLGLNIVGWTCWVPSLFAVEWWMQRGPGRRFAAARS